MWKLLTLGPRVQRILRHQCTIGGNCVCQLPINRRVNTIDTVAEHGHGPAVSLQRTAMRRGVDSLRKTADDRKAAPGQVTGKVDRITHAALRGVPAADDCERWQVQHIGIAIDVQQQRWPRDLCQ